MARGTSNKRNNELREAAPWYPFFPRVSRAVGLDAGLVFGYVWSACGLREHVCSAAQLNIGRQLGMGRHRVNKALRRLVQTGYIQDLSPAEQRSPHRYVYTDKAFLTEITAEIRAIKERQTLYKR